MAEQIDLDIARAVMAQAATFLADPASREAADIEQWSRWIRAFSELCAQSGVKSYIAVLGNALLAKAANPRIDVYSLKARDESGGAYDARRTAEKVLVPASQEYRFSLGTAGPQPLNNQPFFRVYRITRDLPVRGHLRPVLDELLRLLHEIQQYRTEEAVRALAAFVEVRRGYMPRYTTRRGTLAVSTTEQLAHAIQIFVTEQSEGGGRAQAVAGGLLEALYSVERVRVGKRNEPDRQAPGDVCVRQSVDGSSYSQVFEVRDKDVPPHAVLALVSKVAAAGIGRTTLVAVASEQKPLDMPTLRARAALEGVDLQIFTRWSELLEAIAFASEQRELALIESAVIAIRSRIIALELSEQAVARWDELTARHDDNAASSSSSSPTSSS